MSTLRAFLVFAATAGILVGTAGAASAAEGDVQNCDSPVTVICLHHLLEIDPDFNFDIFPD